LACTLRLRDVAAETVTGRIAIVASPYVPEVRP
jgi:hypothetical protein